MWYAGTFGEPVAETAFVHGRGSSECLLSKEKIPPNYCPRGSVSFFEDTLLGDGIVISRFRGIFVFSSTKYFHCSPALYYPS